MSLAIWDEPGVKCWFMTCVGARLEFVKTKQDVGEQLISRTPGRGDIMYCHPYLIFVNFFTLAHFQPDNFTLKSA